MFITVFPNDNSFSWLLIKQSLIKYEYWKAYVDLKKWEIFKKQYIDLWKCNNDFCIVKDWLKDTDLVK
jgi:hypothetical protein